MPQVRGEFLMIIVRNLVCFLVNQSPPFSSPNTNVYLKVEVCQILNIMTESCRDFFFHIAFYDRYGTNIFFFRHITDKITKIVNGWKERALSYG